MQQEFFNISLKMRVDLCFKTEDTPEGKIRIIAHFPTVKEAEAYYREMLEGKVTEAYLRKFDGWHHRVYKHLFRKEG